MSKFPIQVTLKERPTRENGYWAVVVTPTDTFYIGAAHAKEATFGKIGDTLTLNYYSGPSFGYYFLTK